MKCRHCGKPIVLVHKDTFEMACADLHDAADSDIEMQLRQKLTIAQGQIRTMERKAERLVVKAKTWTRVMATLSSPQERQRAVDELADAIDDFDPTLSERAEPEP